jgi:hypothetical protein
VIPAPAHLTSGGAFTRPLRVWKDELVSGDSLDLELATTAVMADNSDVRMLLKMLARQLVATLGDRVRVQYEGGLFKKSDEIKSMRVTLGPHEYAADYKAGVVEPSIGHNSGGIRIRTDRVGMEEWVRRLLTDLQAEAATKMDSKAALESIVLGGGTL